MSVITAPYADLESAEPPTNHRLRRDRDRASLSLRRIAWSAVPAGAALAVALLIDDRMLLGESVWAKPLKFTISVGLTGAATSWLVDRLTPSRVVTAAAVAASVSLVGEQALIILQAARGVRSHFNIDTPFDSAVLSAMGGLVLVAAGTLATLAVASTRRPPEDETTRAVVTGGSWLVVLGSVAGAVMVAANAHSIGGPDGSPGLPILGWNRAIGDLRPAHFVGLHGLQLLIATAALAERAGWAPRPTTTLVRSVTAATAATSTALLVQALAGRPVVSRSLLLVGAAAAAAAVKARATSSLYDVAADLTPVHSRRDAALKDAYIGDESARGVQRRCAASALSTFLRPRVCGSGASVARTQEAAPASPNRNDEDDARGVIRPLRRGRGLWSGH